MFTDGATTLVSAPRAAARTGRQGNRASRVEKDRRNRPCISATWPFAPAARLAPRRPRGRGGGRGHSRGRAERRSRRNRRQPGGRGSRRHSRWHSLVPSKACWAIETGIDVGGDILDLSADVSRMTIVGRLPNRPGFADAVADKGAALHAQYQQEYWRRRRPAAQCTLRSPRPRRALASSAARRAGDNLHCATGPGISMRRWRSCGHFRQAGRRRADNYVECYPRHAGSHVERLQGPGGGGNSAWTCPAASAHLLIGQTSNGDTFFQLGSHGLGNPTQSKVEAAGRQHRTHHGLPAAHRRLHASTCRSARAAASAASEKDGQKVILA